MFSFIISVSLDVGVTSISVQFPPCGMTESLERHERVLREFLAREPFCLHPDRDQIRIFQTAFAHDSFTEEHNKKTINPMESYERLEFLGDAVLEFLVCETAYGLPQLGTEGVMTNDFKQKAVANHCIAEHLRAAGLNVDKVMLVGNAFNSKNGAEINDNMRADVFEAIIAAVYLTYGMECARSIVRKVITDPLIDSLGL